MTENLKPRAPASLAGLMKSHIAAQRGAAREEETARAAIVNYEPRDDQESRLKLTYIAAYLMATRGRLNAHELDAALHTALEGISAACGRRFFSRPRTVGLVDCCHPFARGGLREAYNTI